MDPDDRQERHFGLMVKLMLLFFFVSQVYAVSNAYKLTPAPLDPTMANQVFHDFFIVALVVFQQVPKFLRQALGKEDKNGIPDQANR